MLACFHVFHFFSLFDTRKPLQIPANAGILDHTVYHFSTFKMSYANCTCRNIVDYIYVTAISQKIITVTGDLCRIRVQSTEELCVTIELENPPFS